MSQINLNHFLHSSTAITVCYTYVRNYHLESSKPHLVTCIDEINCWMSANRLKLNTNKTQFILLGTRQQQMKRKSVSFDGVEIPFSDDVPFLGVVFDNELKFSTQIKRLVGKCFYHLRRMRSVRRS